MEEELTMNEEMIMGAQPRKQEGPGVSGLKLGIRPEVPRQKGGVLFGQEKKPV